ncbi:MAG: MnhB domain-containing protein, partial [Planctomycetota bacterium]
AFLLFRMTHGRGALLKLMPFHPRVLVALGLFVAAATAVAPMLYGEPPLRSLVIDEFPIGFGQSIHFASAVFFDAGVLMVVVGVSVGMVQRLNEELDAPPPPESPEDGVSSGDGQATSEGGAG